jgi:hypothetical protein
MRWTWFTAESTDDPATDVCAVLEGIEAHGWEVVSVVRGGDMPNGHWTYRIFARRARSTRQPDELHR